MRISKNAFFIYLINIIKLILTLLIQISESNLIRRYPSSKQHIGSHHHANPTIYVKVGDSINISCLFDPDVITVNHNGKTHQLYGYTSYGQGKPLEQQQQQQQHHQPSSDNPYDQNALDDSSSMFSNYNFDNFMSRKRRQSLRVKNKHHHGRGGAGHAGFITTTSRSLLEDLQESNKPGSSYELDWFFLNKHGVMNIISYGNKTASNKYQLFMSQEGDEDEPGSPSIDSAAMSGGGGSQLSSYSSYSQTHSRSAAALRKPFAFTHYLNVLIESEADEGVYQCINPNLANFIIRNVTVLFESNGQCKLVSASQSWLLSLLFIAYQFINYLFK